MSHQPVSQKELEKMLFEQFDQTYSKWTKRWHQDFREMSREMTDRCRTFGQEPVMAKFASDFGLSFSEIVEKMRGKSNGRASPTKQPRKARRTRRRRLSYSELRLQAVEVIKSFPAGTDFNTRDVQANLEINGFLFQRNHLRVILSRDIAGLEKIGTTPRDGKNQPANIYKITGKITGPVQLHGAPQDLVAHA